MQRFKNSRVYLKTQIMKIIKLSFLMLLFVTSSRAQEAQPNANKTGLEGGLNLYSFTVRPGNFSTAYQPVHDHQIFSGAYFKLYRGRHGFRSEVVYSKRDLRGPKGLYTDGPTTSVELKLGYQYTLIDRRLNLYCFADAGYDYFRTRTHYYWPLYADYIAPPYYQNYLLNGYQLTVSPGLGLRWKIGKHLALTYEGSAQLFYASQKINPDKSGKGESIGINAKPTRLTIGFIF